MKCRVSSPSVVAASLAGSACANPAGRPRPQASRYTLNGPLIPARHDDGDGVGRSEGSAHRHHPRRFAAVQGNPLGLQDFHQHAGRGARFAPGRGSCNNCHLNAGQRERALPLVSVAGLFPEYNRRAGRLISLGDRIVDCFLRSQNATGTLDPAHEAAGPATPDRCRRPHRKKCSRCRPISTWLSRGAEMGRNPSWRGQNTIPASGADSGRQTRSAERRSDLHERCTTCHGVDGQGVAIGNKRPGPLWGPDSWNDGAGAARIYTLAGIIRYTMPYLDPGQSDRRGRPAARGIHQFAAAAVVSLQGSGLPHRAAARPTACITRSAERLDQATDRDLISTAASQPFCNALLPQSV